MIALRLRERQRFADKTGHPLAQGEIPAFLVRSLPGFLTNRMVGTFGQDGLVGAPEVGVGATATIGWRNSLPQPATGGCTAIPDDKGDDLTGAAAQRRPQPLLVLPGIDKRPQFIQFQHVTGLFGEQALRPIGQLLQMRLEPVQDTGPGHAENAVQPPQTRPFSIGAQHLPAPFRLVCRFRLQYSVGSAVFAVILRVACSIPAILLNILAATRSTFIGHGHLNHAADYGLSLTFDHHQLVIWEQRFAKGKLFG